MYRYYIFIIYSSLNRYPGRFHFLPTMNREAMCEGRYGVLGYVPRIYIEGSCGNFFLRNLYLISIIVIPSVLLTYIHAYICCYLFS